MKKDIKESISVSGINLSKEAYDVYSKKSVSAFMYMYLADAKLAEAEAVLRECGGWRLELKKKVNTAINYIRGLTIDMDKSIDKDVAGSLFFKDAEFLGKMTDVLMESTINKEDEIKLLSYIKNTYGRR